LIDGIARGCGIVHGRAFSDLVDQIQRIGGVQSPRAAAGAVAAGWVVVIDLTFGWAGAHGLAVARLLGCRRKLVGAKDQGKDGKQAHRYSVQP
jgi:hypothetical protein